MKVLIIDGNNLQHRAMHAYGGLTNNVKPVSIIYGMPLLTSHMLRQFQPDKVYICWDTDRHKIRLDLHPDYKKKRRVRTKEEIAIIEEQRRVVMRLFNALNITQVVGPGMEADDWIYILTRKHKEDTITIVSSDKDFHQLISKKIRVWNPTTKLLIGRHNVKAHFGYSETECLDYLCLRGDDSDNIKGYMGMGEQNTKIFLSQFGSISNFLEDESAAYKRIDKTKLKELYKRNKMLIGLKQFYLKYLKGKQPKFYHHFNGQVRTSFNKGVLLEICNEYNIKTFRKKGFTKLFKNL